MSTITIENWKVVDDSSPEFEFIPPEYTITYWEIPKWWYKGDRTCYTSCVRIDVGETSVYVDGTTPLMKFTLDWDSTGEGEVTFSDWRDIRRALILKSADLGLVNRGESNEYIDVEFNDYFYKIRYDNYFGPDVIQPLQSDLKPLWVNGNNSGPFYQDPIPFITGTFIGGLEPVTYEVRHKERDEPGALWTTPTAFSPQTNTPTERLLTLDPKTKAQAIHIETKATDVNGIVVYNNGAYLELDNPVPVITTDPTLSIRNYYQNEQRLTGFAGEFTSGLPDAVARARWQWRDNKDNPYTLGDDWTTGVSYLDQITSSPIPAGMIQAKFVYQIIEPSTNSGEGPRTVSKVLSHDITAPTPLEIAPNGGANWPVEN